MALVAHYVTAAGSDTYANATNSGTPCSLTSALAAYAAGDIVEIQKGSYTARTTDTPTLDGTAVSPVVMRGYNATPGDLDTPAYNTDGSLDTSNYPVIEYNAAARLNAAGANYIEWRNLKVGVAGAGFSGGAFVVGISCFIHQCYAYNPSTNAAATALQLGAFCIVENCDLALTGASGGLGALNVAGGSCRVFGNRIIESQIAGINIAAASGDAVIEDNVFFAAVVGPCIDSLLTAANTVTVRHNTAQGKAIFYRSAAVTITSLQYFGNNHVTDMSTAAFVSLQDGTAQLPAVFSHNRFRDNTVNVDGWDGWRDGATIAEVTTDTGGAGTDYTDASTNQYRLIAGAPGVGTASTPNRDTGALQRAATGSSAHSSSYSA